MNTTREMPKYDAPFIDLVRGYNVVLRAAIQHEADSGGPVEECDVPPLGWRCTRGKDHTGPCAAIESPEDVALVERGMARLRKTPNLRCSNNETNTSEEHRNE